jgi:hypothetical protein
MIHVVIQKQEGDNVLHYSFGDSEGSFLFEQGQQTRPTWKILKAPGDLSEYPQKLTPPQWVALLGQDEGKKCSYLKGLKR